jgi:NadR type nicotinamide-nucleotide adenylyltransferase
MSAMPAAGRPYRLGLVVGKFAPLHLGHQALIEAAARSCDELLILSYSNPEFERCEVSARRRWFESLYPEHQALIFDEAWLRQACRTRGVDPRPLPANDSSDETQQRFLGWLLGEVLQRRPDAMFCSESYGPACAARLTAALKSEVKAVIVDEARRRVPVSATQIRAEPLEHRRWMNPAVAADFVHRIALLGGESSGKTTLACALAAHFETLWVPEYGRELWERQSGILTEAHLLEIAGEQIRREEEKSRSANRYLFCDTSPLTTAGYGEWMFGHIHPKLAELAARRYDALVLCRPDFPFVQDGTRRDGDFRDRQHAWYRERTAALGCPVLEVGGSVPQRVLSVANWLSRLNP